jgi:hypothetical protein
MAPMHREFMQDNPVRGEPASLPCRCPTGARTSACSTNGDAEAFRMPARRCSRVDRRFSDRLRSGSGSRSQSGPRALSAIEAAATVGEAADDIEGTAWAADQEPFSVRMNPPERLTADAQGDGCAASAADQVLVIIANSDRQGAGDYEAVDAGHPVHDLKPCPDRRYARFNRWHVLWGPRRLGAQHCLPTRILQLPVAALPQSLRGGATRHPATAIIFQPDHDGAPDRAGP